ncbi:hypothetical protein VP277E431_P0134 [Vibrio phage 277E43-1]|nr:hypothetical protein VP277E431_P0134 [Vibrio phage 277E43-1]
MWFYLITMQCIETNNVYLLLRFYYVLQNFCLLSTW